MQDFTYFDNLCRPYLLKFAENQEEFFHVYSSAHKKMSELGSKFKFIVNIKLV